ncbi:iron-containing alcohol dehydrogenase [Desulfosporosinus sp. BICA1-9]|uniref:iron-containing alcohol dehydrogenase n=1 Tax=Desulfosporosinus sp. BICA1-9 TaxID=1531958 RepID=UPI00054C08CC|nr:iron-containing alcohol dehydrogenase [Desulfosporosinus sp. BICA1-9]KJS48968.1 MAG: alcohol dehydrogenase [Peptococcaceae bacterium BRH_c23]KJS84048.1 MAG: alcohol dehydrogenase [Desulfosporosinus sp. BICA1-9]HBW33899.1 L-threonine dehydrogenase [Desulfosporosinus sp.]
MENTHNFILPKTNLIGIGAIKDLPNELLSWKLSKVLIVTDKNMISLGYVENVEKILKNLFISYDIFDGILHPNPTVSFVEDGLTYLKKGLNIFKRNYKLIISIGGGTNHDCAKAIATVATNGGSIIDYEGYNKVTKPAIPQIAINTTAGSAAELTMVAIITDNSRKVKMTISSPFLTPFITVNDPIFMTSMPKEVTASSGIDVVSHAIEAYVSTEASPITDSLALEALKLAFEYLPRAYENGNDLEAREKMMFANIMAGMAFNNAGLGYVHCMAHQLGGFYNQTHGCYNAVLLPYVFEFNSVSIPEQRILKICEAMGIITHNRSQAVDLIIDSINKLRSKIEIPGKLSEMGLMEGDIEPLSQNALKDICFFTNPRQGFVEDFISLYKAAF